MESFKNITIVAISDVKIKKTLTALIKSSQEINAADSLFFSSRNIELNLTQQKLIKKISINPINSLKDYSEFIIYSLHKHIKTSHVLIVQWDGYICDVNKWNSNLLNYDYIGAPFIPRFKNFNYSRDKEGRFYVIGNGGFSLRSKRLLESASKFNLFDNYFLTKFHEDGFYCVLHRNFLESKGFNWATDVY